MVAHMERKHINQKTICCDFDLNVAKKLCLVENITFKEGWDE